MPLIDVKCLSDTCEHVFEYYRPISEWPKTPVCEACGHATEQAYTPRAMYGSAPPVVVFRAPDGTHRFPGEPDGRSARNYEKLGYERVEIRGAVEMRSFESKMNKSERSRAVRQLERQHEARERRESDNRSKLRDEMKGMSRFGREVARTAMRNNDHKPVKRAVDPNFHSEVYSMDRSNRETSRDERGNRRRD